MGGVGRLLVYVLGGASWFFGGGGSGVTDGIGPVLTVLEYDMSIWG